MEKITSSSKLILVLTVLCLLSFQDFGEAKSCKTYDDCATELPFCRDVACQDGKCICVSPGVFSDASHCSKDSNCDELCGHEKGVCLKNGQCGCINVAFHCSTDSSCDQLCGHGNGVCLKNGQCACINA